MYLTTVNRLRLNQNEFNLVKELCWLSKNLYNSTLYEVRQHYFNTSEFLKYTKAYHILKNTENYKLLPSQVAQQTMKVVERTMKSFFGLLREKKKGNYNKPIKIPRYLNKEGKFVLLYTPAHMRYISNNQIRLTVKKELLEKHNLKELIITIPKHIIGKTIKELRINPLGQFLKVEFIYLNNENNYPKVTKNKNILSIDLGIDNLCTMINNVNNQPIIIDGREIKSINRLFNKNLSKYKSISKKVNDRYSTKKIDRLYYKRNNVFKDKFHKVSNYIINYCIDNNISKVIIGYNQEWKQNINIGKTNQALVQMPYTRLTQYIKYKAELRNITVLLQEESYTSKCDALALEEVKKHREYKGKRVYRGLFKSSTGKLINADVNGAINIARKCMGKTLNSWVKELACSGVVNTPIKVRVS